jgi:hypothetical protein
MKVRGGKWESFYILAYLLKLIIARCFMLCSQLKESLVVLEEKVMNVMELIITLLYIWKFGYLFRKNHILK